MRRLSRITLPAVVAAFAFSLSPETANAMLITAFDFSGELTTGEQVDFGITFDPFGDLTRIDPFTEVYSTGGSSLFFEGTQFASETHPEVLQREGTDAEFFPDLWGFTAVLIGGNQTITLTVSITDPSLSLIQPGVIFSVTDLLLLDTTAAFLIDFGGGVTATGTILSALTRTIGVDEPRILLLMTLGLAALGFAAGRKAR